MAEYSAEDDLKQWLKPIWCTQLAILINMRFMNVYCATSFTGYWRMDPGSPAITFCGNPYFLHYERCSCLTLTFGREALFPDGRGRPEGVLLHGCYAEASPSFREEYYVNSTPLLNDIDNNPCKALCATESPRRRLCHGWSLSLMKRQVFLSGTISFREMSSTTILSWHKSMMLQTLWGSRSIHLLLSPTLTHLLKALCLIFMKGQI